MNRNDYALRYTALFNSNFEYPPLQKSVPASKKIVLFSDSHLDTRFNDLQFRALRKIITAADVVVIAGDFWADKYITFDAFMKTKWRKLFPYLKKKETYYLFGNHDMPLHSDDRIFTFCTHAGFWLKLKAGALLLHIEHGHLRSNFLIRAVLLLFEKHPKVLHILTIPIEQLSMLYVDVLKRTGIPLSKRVNTSYKHKRIGLDPQEILVMGHTHTPEIDLNMKYVNLGLTHHGYFSYVLIENNTISLNTIAL